MELSEKVKIKKYGMILLVVLMFILVGKTLTTGNRELGTGKEEKSPISYEQKFTLIVDNPDELLWTNAYNEMKKVALKDNVFIEMVDKGSEQSFKTSDYINMATAANADGIIVQANNSKSVRESINRAKHSSIPVVTVVNDAINSSRVGYMGMNSYQLGKDFGGQIRQVMTEKKKNHLNILILVDGTTEHMIQTFSLGVKDLLAERNRQRRDVDISTYKLSHKSLFSSDEEIREVLLGSEKIPDVLIGLNSEDTMSSAQAVTDYNMVGDIAVLGYIGNESIFREINSGVIHSIIDIDATFLGRESYKVLKQFKDAGYTNEYSPLKTVVINKSNVKEYMEKIDETY